MNARPWRSQEPPRSILAIRLQAMGDVAITLPYLRALGRSLPDAAIDLVTRREVADLPRACPMFRRIDALGGGRSERRQLLRAALLAPLLIARRYDAVIDLQNNRVSRTIRRAARPRAWSSFDRESSISAGERTRLTIEAAGFPLPRVEAGLPLRDADLGLAILNRAKWDPARALVILSPAGAFATRNWPIERYGRFADLWRQRRPSVQFAILGLESLGAKAAILKAALGADLLDLVGRTTPSEALAIVQRAALVVTEDCGLMHMAWVSGVPTLALFGSSRSDWSAPLGRHTRCLHSGDLECGACMAATCRLGDIRCLTRYSPEQVVIEAERLLRQASGGPAIIAPVDWPG